MQMIPGSANVVGLPHEQKKAPFIQRSLIINDLWIRIKTVLPVLAKLAFLWAPRRKLGSLDRGAERRFLGTRLAAQRHVQGPYVTFTDRLLGKYD